MWNVCFVTGSRAEYGIMKSLISKLDNDSEINLDIIATAMHMEEKYGYTYKIIENDGFKIYKKIEMNLHDTFNKTILEGIAYLTKKLADVFTEKKYDLVLILGDRYEMLAVANASIIFNIPICHLHGGELTLGNYDEFIRHAITKMSHIHFASTEKYKNRIIQMGEQPQNVFNIGAIGVENVIKENFYSKKELEKNLNIILEDEYNVVLFHPVTIEGKEPLEQILNLLNALDNFDRQYIFIGSNSDTGSDEIMEKITKYVEKSDKHKLFTSLPTVVYHSLVKYSQGLIGNSSSGLIEIPSLKVPTLNIGDRQKGRIAGKSVINVECQTNLIINAIEKMRDINDFSNPYEKYNSAQIAYEILKKELIKGVEIQKDFYDITCFSKEGD